ncbi:hypothetical protein [Wolbachia endosymbiont (group A) of Sphaerophoria taeniata]|nr:hypothetical protein [Wolbachia endosymbiont (group A) of Sphaerophoria taeniata]
MSVTASSFHLSDATKPSQCQAHNCTNVVVWATSGVSSQCVTLGSHFTL